MKKRNCLLKFDIFKRTNLKQRAAEVTNREPDGQVMAPDLETARASAHNNYVGPIFVQLHKE